MPEAQRQQASCLRAYVSRNHEFLCGTYNYVDNIVLWQAECKILQALLC